MAAETTTATTWYDTNGITEKISDDVRLKLLTMAFESTMKIKKKFFEYMTSNQAGEKAEKMYIPLEYLNDNVVGTLARHVHQVLDEIRNFAHPMGSTVTVGFTTRATAITLVTDTFFEQFVLIEKYIAMSANYEIDIVGQLTNDTLGWGITDETAQLVINLAAGNCYALKFQSLIDRRVLLDRVGSVDYMWSACSAPYALKFISTIDDRAPDYVGHNFNDFEVAQEVVTKAGENRPAAPEIPLPDQTNLDHLLGANTHADADEKTHARRHLIYQLPPLENDNVSEVKEAQHNLIAELSRQNRIVCRVPGIPSSPIEVSGICEKISKRKFGEDIVIIQECDPNLTNEKIVNLKILAAHHYAITVVLLTAAIIDPNAMAQTTRPGRKVTNPDLLMSIAETFQPVKSGVSLSSAYIDELRDQGVCHDKLYTYYMLLYTQCAPGVWMSIDSVDFNIESMIFYIGEAIVYCTDNTRHSIFVLIDLVSHYLAFIESTLSFGHRINLARCLDMIVTLVRNSRTREELHISLGKIRAIHIESFF